MNEETGRTVPLSARLRNSIEYRTGLRLKRRRLPKSAGELKNSDVFNSWWYYSVELLPGLVTKGIYPPDLPMLPRMLLRRCDLDGAVCLDLGSMEGLMPVLMRRGGAKEVLATDASGHCMEKIEAVQHYYEASFNYKSVGLMYDLDRKLRGRSFDLINCSGLLYHVFSPLTMLAGMRALLKKNGLLIVSTNVVLDDSYTMEFNNAGRMQTEGNTFWYLSVKLFDYLLRYLKLVPIDCLFLPHEAIHSDVKYLFDKKSGYLSVVCRAVERVLPTRDDEWMSSSAKSSWEYLWMPDWKMAEQQPVSRIKYKGRMDERFVREDLECIDLWEAVRQSTPVTTAKQLSDSHFLSLSDFS